MNSFKSLALIFVVMLCSSRGWAQEIDAFQQRLVDIKAQLALLSDSLSPGLKETANFSVTDISIQSFLRTLAESHDLNIQVDPSLTILLSNNFTSVAVQDIIYFLCQEHRLDVRFTNSILSFRKYEPPPIPEIKPVRRKIDITYDEATGKISFNLQHDSLRSVVKEITRLSGRNVVASVGNEMDNHYLSGYIVQMPFENALDKLAYINSLRLTKAKDGVFIIESNQPQANQFNPQQNLPQRNSLAGADIVVQDSLISIDVVNYPILEVIKEASTQLGINYILFSDILGNTTARVQRVTYSELLSFLFQGTNYTFKQKAGVYLLGQRIQEGFRTSEVIKLDFRTIDGLEKEIPTDLLKEVELKVLKELNAFLVTGNKQRIDEIASFIKLVDRPIPNILIEVIVAEAKKSFTIQTGIKAFLSDSIPRTSGQVFPGLDVTVNSNAINNVLSKLSDNGIVNLGPVPKNFYATIQALETNDNFQVRSTPKLSTMNGNKAMLTIGESQYYAEQTQNITGGVAPIQSTTTHWNKVEANLAITITPVVSGNEHITLDITAEFSNFVLSGIPNAPPGNRTRKFESKIRVRNEEVIVLGGLEQLSNTEGGSGVPLLSRIPVLKWIFSSKTKKKDDSRLFVFIKPTVVY